ncbi:cupin domain-containing protein [Alkalihalobacillus oceani]|uniref:cupin domain-containing protein n=1 Tax=Halalkalibacter oceani TaxID=1653776 RepID=UPI0020405D88|nr:cupin domain-containing protein [Halalkalibacter oceani]MCM3759630.1 cupin domain-containing protein [Halalkalibacter oceani]
MNNRYYLYPYHNYYYGNTPIHNQGNIRHWHTPSPPPYTRSDTNASVDHGKNPFVVNINQAAKQNETYRTAIWTGDHLQVTLMSINVGDDIGLEIHPNVDQFLRIESGQGLVKMGKSKNQLTFQTHVSDDSAIMIPADTWHNVINTGNTPLKLYSIYAPPHHAFGTVHRTKADAVAAED